MTSVTVRHNFETAHRLPHLGGKCSNLHGHSWWCEVTVTGAVDARGVVVDFGVLKRDVRAWIDENLDHGVMLGCGDPLLSALRSEGSKVFEFGADALAKDLAWPTVENVAELLRRVTAGLLADSWRSDVVCEKVRVTETHVNVAEVTT